MIESAQLEAMATKAFQAYDNDGSGYVEYPELHGMMKDFARDLGIPEPSAMDVHHILTKYDQDLDYKLNLKEFHKLMKIFISNLK